MADADQFRDRDAVTLRRPAEQSLTDPVFDPLQPEVLLYAPAANGKLRLVAVAYVVIDVGQPRPAFAGHPFDIGGVTAAALITGADQVCGRADMSRG